MVKSKIYLFQKYFDGYPKKTDFKLVEKELPPIKDNEFLAEAAYFSIDPYMRSYSVRYPLGIPFVGSQVAKIIESKNPDFPVGKYVVANFDWKTYTVSDGKAPEGHVFTQDPYLLPDIGNIRVSTGLGVLGMPGNTAYFGVTEILKPKQGDTVVISGAAGAVGSIAGQLCKLMGCKVVGITGSKEKGKWLVEDLGFDTYINYKSRNLDEALKEVAPEGIDRYFDNVGGEITFSVLKHMNHYGHTAVCGGISGYNETDPQIPDLALLIVMKELSIQGFHVHRWLDRWNEGIPNNLKLIQEGKLKYKETVFEGFENLYQAFLSMNKGEGIGKIVVKA
ncbi:prostaglandin reductase 1-like [Diabrotica undecimpunctata]|uniref:prostaglandin reductase 1-like n=1 Tax=Diabrotica undecimpunctata TaxID=50387 RepID=UPI003B63D579